MCVYIYTYREIEMYSTQLMRHFKLDPKLIKCAHSTRRDIYIHRSTYIERCRPSSCDTSSQTPS